MAHDSTASVVDESVLTQKRTSRMAKREEKEDKAAPLEVAAGLVGLLFLLVGLLGFIPGITTGFDQLHLGGHHSAAKLFGLFTVSWLHNLAHLGFGVAGLAVTRRERAARWYLLAGGAVYLALWLYGILVPLDGPANFVPLNQADNWLHLALGIGMVGLGLVVKLEQPREARGDLDQKSGHTMR